MRREEREISDISKIMEIMKKCDICSIALTENGDPYVVPVNFGISEENGAVTLYFHGSGEGTKMDLIRSTGRAAFCMVAERDVEIYEPACRSTMRYESVCGRGCVSVVESVEEKLSGLTCIMRQYDRDSRGTFDFDPKAVGKTVVLKLTAERISGKINSKPDREA